VKWAQNGFKEDAVLDAGWNGSVQYETGVSALGDGAAAMLVGIFSIYQCIHLNPILIVQGQ
jgi:hypothetical protein